MFIFKYCRTVDLGNRGKCAQPCRLPYSIIDENNTILDKGYLLSTKDLCGLEYIPNLINAGVTSLKIEGRMKSPEYVAIVTKIYRKYIDLAYSSKPYVVEDQDKKLLALVFNRGGFSNGHLNQNHNLIYKEKPNNMGLFLGTVNKYNSKKGLISLKLNENLSIGDSISLEKEPNLYNVSELIVNNQNCKSCNSNYIATIGRMKGNINIGDKVYKMSDKKIYSKFQESFKENAEFKKIPLNATLDIKLNKPVKLTITCNSPLEIYKSLNITCFSELTPMQAKNSVLTKEKIVNQISKIQNTPYEFTNININLDNNLFLPNSVLNELKRNAINKVEEFALNNIHRKYNNLNFKLPTKFDNMSHNIDVSVLLNILDLNMNYSNLENINNLYIPLKYFLKKEYHYIIHSLEKKFNLFVYLPTIMRTNYNTLFEKNLDNLINTFLIQGFVISNISGLNIIKKLKNKYNKDFYFIGNYTLNVFNCFTSNNLLNLGLNKITFSPELDYSSIINLCDTTNSSELIVYGNTPLMNINYCPLGKTNLCINDCNNTYCKSKHKFYLNDRMNFNFRILSDNIDTVTTIYNSKTTSFNYEDFNVSSVRIDILDEDIEEINNIVNVVKNKRKLEGNNYTNGNINKSEI